ncbi:hypothetical protein GCM10025862_14620 [Arsenicicoccus piscis]|uniref:Secreted protein n=1 Tax=Arsenicicoccus piscis TaxID=673954 RepID=A0ABQ6HM42_9MICO|nr:hypothetical protein GCM10025862_14620 [Arsenicicoccus piscis]
MGVAVAVAAWAGVAAASTAAVGDTVAAARARGTNMGSFLVRAGGPGRSGPRLRGLAGDSTGEAGGADVVRPACLTMASDRAERVDRPSSTWDCFRTVTCVGTATDGEGRPVVREVATLAW